MGGKAKRGDDVKRQGRIVVDPGFIPGRIKRLTLKERLNLISVPSFIIVSGDVIKNSNCGDRIDRNNRHHCGRNKDSKNSPTAHDYPNAGLI
jgi:hypothetical protein